MENWTPSKDHPGYRSKTVQVGSCTVVIHRPELAEQERAKRERHAKDVLAATMKKYIEQKETKA